ncbi:MAG: hypothetical protein Q8O67_22140 [Deltaproteobacteria bacterium]|nr:hypothetical protein [Deltaproteobacteria bacterium]
MNALLRLERNWVMPLMRVALIAWLLVTRFFEAPGRLAASLHKRPIEVLDAPHLEALLHPLGLWPMPAGFVDAIGPVLWIGSVCALLGIATRLSLVATAFAFFVCNAVGSGWGFFNHTPALPEQVLIALALLPGTTGFSVDRWLLLQWRRRRGDRSPWIDTVCPLVPRFGEVFVFVVVGLFYAASGIAKVRLGLGGWLSGETLQWYLAGGAAKHQYWYGPAGGDTISGYLYVGQATPLGLLLSSSQAITAVLSWTTLLAELGALVFLLMGGWWRVGWIAVAIVFHIVVRITLGPGFSDWILIDVVLGMPLLITLLDDRKKRRHAALLPTTTAASAA